MIERLVIAALVAAATIAIALWWRRREGRFSEAQGSFERGDLGLSRRERPSALLVEFSGEGCAPCRTVEARLTKLASEIPDVRFVTIDAGRRLDLADRYGVRRVPTIFVADGDLKIIWRASGVPSEDSIRGALLGPDWAGRPSHQATASGARR